MAVHFHEEDLGEGVAFADGPIAIDTEAMGLNPHRDRLCVVQLSDGRRRAPGPLRDGQRLFGAAAEGAPRRSRPPQDLPFRPFDIGIIQAYLGIMAAPLYCTRTASRIARTYTDRHGLKDLVKEILGHEISKQQQTSDWGAPELSEAQREYAASDVRFLHQLKARLDERLEREGRDQLAQACFDFLPARALLDLAGWAEQDILAHDG